jgi:putative transposase
MNESAIIDEVQLTATQWLWIYNNECPSMVPGGITPAMKLAKFLN